MDDKTQKERLEQELRFLKESFDAEVISKDEFEKGKDRIEKKLKEIQVQEKNKEQTAQKPELKTEQKKEDTTEKREEEKIKLNVIQDEAEEHGHFEPIQEQKEDVQEQKPLIEESKSDGKFFKYAVIFVVLLLVVFFSYSFVKNKPSKETAGIKFVAACSSDFDCRQEGKEGICLNPQTKDARCEFKEIQKTNVIVLNDRKNCFNCHVQRVLSILENWFGAINVNEIDYNTEKGKSLAEKFDAKLLPMYILDGNITKKSEFEKFKQAFAKKDSSFLLNDDAAGSTFYVKRENMPNKLDLFVKAGDTAGIKSENNLKEFLDNFKDIKFEKHLSADKLAQELNIKTFPTFLINNRIKFSGVVTADTIKGNFCEMNKLPECEKSLSRSLV